MNLNPRKIMDFIHKSFSIRQNAIWKTENYAEFLAIAASHNTYLETVNAKNMPNADTLHYRIVMDTHVNVLMNAFLATTNKQLRKLRNRRVIVIIDYTYEPFFGNTQNEWVHGYKPANGSRGCYKFLAASIIVDDQRYFVYTKPVSAITDETFELWQILAHIKMLGIRIKVVLIDRGLARNAENIALLKDMNVKYLGLYQKYKNIKKIIKRMKRNFINRKFKIKGIPTRLVIGKEKFTWVFVTNLEFTEFVNYLRLYKKRWNIETGFRVQDEACIKTKSIDIRVRYFLFLVALLLYNVWKSLCVAISFKRFVVCIVWDVIRNETKPT